MATVRFVSWGAIPVGSLVAGAVGVALGPRGALLAFGVLTVLGPATLWFSRVRTLRDFTDFDDSRLQATEAAPA